MQPKVWRLKTKIYQMTHAHRNILDQTDDVGGYKGYGKLHTPKCY